MTPPLRDGNNRTVSGDVLLKAMPAIGRLAEHDQFTHRRGR